MGNVNNSIITGLMEAIDDAKSDEKELEKNVMHDEFAEDVKE